MTEPIKEDRKPRVLMNRAAMRAAMVGCIVVALGFFAALLAQAGLFTSNPGLPNHPDGLTTLALVLAILAFLVQVFVFVIQTNAANSSVRRSEELNAKTHAVLRKIESDSSATQRVLFSQFDRLLDYVVDRPVESRGGGDVRGADSEEVEEEEVAVGNDVVEEDVPGPVTAAEVQRIVSDAIRPRDRPSFEVNLPRQPSEEDEQVIRYLRAWPSREEAEAAVVDLVKLSPLALVILARFGTQEVRQRREGLRVGLFWGTKAPPPMQELLAAGFAKESEGQRHGIAALTERGRELARSIPVGKTVKGEPDWYSEVFAPLCKPR